MKEYTEAANNNLNLSFINNTASNARIDGRWSDCYLKFINTGDIGMSPRKKEALAFKFWITHEVLPNIRKTGSYNVPSQANKTIEEIKFDMSLALFRETSNALRYNDNSKLMMLHKTAETYGLPNTLPAYTVAKDVTFSASHLLKQFDCGISARAFNKMLLADGYIEEKERKSTNGFKKFKSLTDKGLEYGENKVSPHNPNETQPHYFENKFQELFNKVTK